MTETETLQITTPSERELAMTRIFDAPRELVFRALTEPELVKRWLLGPPGWKMPVCEIDLRVGGAYRYEWYRESDDSKMGMGGVYREIVAPERIVFTEAFDQAWYPGEGLGTSMLIENDGRTKLIQSMEYESREARDAVLASPMEDGVAASYDRLAKVLASLEAAWPSAVGPDAPIQPRDGVTRDA